MDNNIPHILIVDDDVNMLSTMREILRMKGFEPVIAPTGTEALAQLEGRAFDLALIDLRLGDMSGLKILSAIKTRTPETECILLTGHASQDTAIEAIQMGVYGYFQKPLDMEQALLSIQRALEKVAAGNALRESERFAHATVDALSSHLAILDETGVILAVNRAWREFAKANSNGNHHLKLCEGTNYLTVCDASKGKDSEEALAMSDGIRAVISGRRKEFLLEYPCHSPDEKRWFNARVTRFPGEGALRIVVAHENITERKLAEEKIAQTEKRYRSLIENAPDGVVLIGLDGKYKYASPAALKIFDYKPEDVIDANPNEQTHPDDLSMVLGVLQDIIENPSKVPTIQYRFQHQNGKWRWIESTFTNLLAEPSVEAVVINFRDINESRKAEEAVRESQQRFSQVWEATSDAMALSDPDGIVLAANPAYLDLYGYTLEQVVGTSFAIIFPEEIQAQAVEQYKAVFASEVIPPTFESAIRRADGSERTVESNVAFLTRTEQRVAMLSTIRDITERKQAEDALRKSLHSLEEAERISQVGHYEIDAQSGKASWSQEVFRIFGIDPAKGEPTVEEYAQLIHPQDSNALNEMYTQSATQGTPFDLVYRILRSDGEIRHVHSQAETARNEQGQITKLFGTFQDITERKQAEENKEASLVRERFLAGLIRDASIAIGVGYPDGRLGMCNLAFQKLTGYSEEELKNISWNTVLTPPEWMESERQSLAKLHRTKQSVIYEKEYIHKSGKRTPIELVAHPLYDADGDISHYYAFITDITERKQANEALLESEKRYRSIFDGVQDAIFIETKDGNILEVNNSACEMYGYTRDEFLTKTVSDFVLEGSPVFAPTPQQPNAPIETFNSRANGEVFPIEISGGVQVINGEEVLLAIVRDITKRKKAEESLQESEERFRVIFEKANDAIHIENADDKILAVNSRMCELMGYSREELLKMHVADLQAPERRQLGGVISREFARHNSSIFEALNLHHNGRRIPVEISIGLIERPSGNLYISVVRDITERKQAERDIRQRVKELELLYQSGLVFSQLLNPKEIAQKIIKLLGEKLDWHHTTIRLIRGQDELELVAFDQPGLEDKSATEARFNKLITRVGEGLSGWAIQQSKTIRLGEVNNDPHYVASYPNLHSGLYVPLKSGDRMVGVISIESEQPNAFNEADEQLLVTLANQAANAFENARLYEETSRHAQELEQRVQERTTDLSRVNTDLAQAMRVKDEFLASMSHELRTPLTGILGLSEVLQLRVYGELNDKQSSTLKTIEESGRHLLDLINDILDLSKIEAGKLELQFAPYSLADLCQASLQLIKGMAQYKHQHVRYSPPAESIVIHADARRLKQLLVNLLSNAIKFTPENGELGLEVEASQSERNIKLTVWDKGIGIKAEDMKKLFKPFVQLDSGLAREYSGTGLGLSLVQHLTELHNGGIQVESNIGQGSRFTVILPWSPQNTAPNPYITQRGNTGRLFNSVITPEENSKSPLVMYVDDNEMLLQMVSDFLEAKQYRVIKARSGIELLEQAAENHPDIMLVDIQMPGIGGMETIRRVRSHPDPLVAATPVIAVTALAMSADRERCLRAGANDYMSKPLKLIALAAAIQKLLDERKP